MANLLYKVFKSTIDDLIKLSYNSEDNTYILCGISDKIINFFTETIEHEGIVPIDKEEFHYVKLTENGIVLDYKGNHIILQKSIAINKPLKELEITYLDELGYE